MLNENFVKKTKYNKLTSKVDHLEDKIPDMATLTCINQCNAHKQNLERKVRNVHINLILGNY